MSHTPAESSDLDKSLEQIWGAAIDFATSDDFKDLHDDERDKAYFTYKRNVIAEAKHHLQAHDQTKRAELRQAINKIYGEPSL